MNKIKEILKTKGIKQTWLADRLGKSYNMVNGYVQNRRQPSLEDLYKISEILDIDIKELLASNKANHCICIVARAITHFGQWPE